MGPPSRFEFNTFWRVWQLSIGVNFDESFFIAIGPCLFRINWNLPPPVRTQKDEDNEVA